MNSIKAGDLVEYCGNRWNTDSNVFFLGLVVSKMYTALTPDKSWVNVLWDNGQVKGTCLLDLKIVAANEDLSV